jgi:hypothetical protein
MYLYCRYAILLDSIGEYEGTKARIRHSPDVRKHLERALELNNKDATTWHILGNGYTAFKERIRFAVPFIKRFPRLFSSFFYLDS